MYQNAGLSSRGSADDTNTENDCDSINFRLRSSYLQKLSPNCLSYYRNQKIRDVSNKCVRCNSLATPSDRPTQDKQKYAMLTGWLGASVKIMCFIEKWKAEHERMWSSHRKLLAQNTLSRIYNDAKMHTGGGLVYKHSADAIWAGCLAGCQLAR